MQEFLNTDRCDRCSARAYHVARKPGMELWLCNHHHREHVEKLLESYWLIESHVDLTTELTAKTVVATE